MFPIVVLANVSDVGVKVRFTTDATAVPDSANCFDPDGYVTVTNPVFVPAVVGANLTLIVQLLFAGSVAGQSFVCEKSVVDVMLLNVKDDVPAFVSTADWLGDVFPIVVLANVRDVGVKARPTTDATAVPVSATFCGLVESLSTMVRLPEVEPAVEGLKATAIVQEAPPASVAGEVGHVVEDTGKDVPELIEEIVRAAVPRFFRVTFCAGDVCPTAMSLHESDAGETETPAGTTVPVPVTEADAGTFDAA